MKIWTHLRRGLAMLALFAVSFLASPRAEAAYHSGYVCEVMFVPSYSPPSMTAGYLSVSFHAGPGCTGSYIDSGRVCSHGTGGSYCAANWRFSELGLLAMFENLQRAAADGQRVHANFDTVTGYLNQIRFRAD